MSRHPVAGLVLVTLLWGAAFPIQKAALHDVGPVWIATLRAVSAAAVMAPALFLGPALGRRGHLIACWIGVCNLSLFFGLQALGLLQVSPGVAAGVIFTQPVLVLVLGHFTLGERLTARAAAGAVLVVPGVVLLGWTGDGVPAPLGCLVLLAGALAWAVGTVGLRIALDLPTVRLVAASNVYGALPLVAASLLLGETTMPTPRVWWAAIYLGVLATALAWWILAAVLTRWPAWRASALLALTPAIAALLSVATGAGQATGAMVLGLLLISLATLCALSRDSQRGGLS